MRFLVGLMMVLCLLLVSCGDDDAPATDSGADAAADVQVEAAVDVAAEAILEAAPDEGTDTAEPDAVEADTAEPDVGTDQGG